MAARRRLRDVFPSGLCGAQRDCRDRTGGSRRRRLETILEGEAGLFAAFRRQPAPAGIRLFAGPQPEIMAVYNKPAPACNFAQTAAQAALRVARELGTSEDIETVSIRVPEAAARYPGCDSKGPFRNALQAKMSIPFSVAAVLARGALEEDNYAQIDDPRILRLVDRTELQSAPDLTAAFPAKQGAEIVVGLRNGKTIHQRLDNVIAATPEEIRARFRQAAADVIGDKRARQLEELVDNCESLRTAASSPRSAGLSRRNGCCGQRHDR